jgi:hypothetical protein
MKRAVNYIIVIAIVTAMLIFCTACTGNKSVRDHNNTINIVHICDSVGNCVDYNVKTWYDNQGSGIGFITTDGNYIWCSEGTYIMASEYCPICGRK